LLISLAMASSQSIGELSRHKLSKACLIFGTRLSSGNAVVSFVVDKIDYDPTSAVDDYCSHLQFSRGDYGCFVDSQCTRIVQLGTQQKGLPDIPSCSALREDFSFCSVE
jgi:peroxin-6